MSRPGDPPGPDGSDLCGCDPEKVFEFADGGPPELTPEQEREIRGHLASCSGCRELYERELHLNAVLSSLDFSAACSRSVSRGVAMALPTRSLGARLLWGLLAGALLVVAFLSLGFGGGTKPVILGMNALGACWDFVVGSMSVAHAVVAAAGSTILLVLAAGALADLLIVFVVLSVSRHRRAREA